MGHWHTSRARGNLALTDAANSRTGAARFAAPSRSDAVHSRRDLRLTNEIMGTIAGSRGPCGRSCAREKSRWSWERERACWANDSRSTTSRRMASTAVRAHPIAAHPRMACGGSAAFRRLRHYPVIFGNLIFHHFAEPNSRHLAKRCDAALAPSSPANRLGGVARKNFSRPCTATARESGDVAQCAGQHRRGFVGDELPRALGSRLPSGTAAAPPRSSFVSDDRASPLMSLPASIEIIGGGLAGFRWSGAATGGMPVTIFEAGDYPRHRVCGEFISGLESATIDRLGLAPLLADALRHHESPGSSAKNPRASSNSPRPLSVSADTSSMLGCRGVCRGRRRAAHPHPRDRNRIFSRAGFRDGAAAGRLAVDRFEISRRVPGAGARTRIASWRSGLRRSRPNRKRPGERVRSFPPASAFRKRATAALVLRLRITHAL